MVKSYKLKPKTYTILSDCIDRGIERGYNKAHKHIDNPDRNKIEEEIRHAIMIEISEYFDFE